jgi:hypothetical protein
MHLSGPKDVEELTESSAHSIGGPRSGRAGSGGWDHAGATSSSVVGIEGRRRPAQRPTSPGPGRAPASGRSGVVVAGVAVRRGYSGPGCVALSVHHRRFQRIPCLLPLLQAAGEALKVPVAVAVQELIQRDAGPAGGIGAVDDDLVVPAECLEPVRSRCAAGRRATAGMPGSSPAEQRALAQPPRTLIVQSPGCWVEEGDRQDRPQRPAPPGRTR